MIRNPITINPLCDSRYKLSIENLTVSYGGKCVVENINLNVCRGCVTAVIGPSGCGKSTLLMSVNRLIETVPGSSVQGRVFLDGVNILDKKIKLQNVRRRIGLIFQRPNPFPISIYKNIALGIKEHDIASGRDIEERVEQSLRSVGLWGEVKDRLSHSALTLSGGQQQRLCLARALALHPEVLLMDEPCSSLDPVASSLIEELIKEMAKSYTLLVVTHNLAQARRISSNTAFMFPQEGRGRLVEFGTTADVFRHPQRPETRDYVLGRVG